MGGKRRDWLKDINIIVYFLVMIFNISAWIDVSAIWAEMPFFVNYLPEGWNFPTYITVITQVGITSNVIFVVVKCLFQEKLRGRDWPLVYFIIGVGITCIFALAFIWDTTVTVNGSKHSIPLMAAVSLLAFVDKLANLVFINYMRQFKPQYLTAFFVGEGLCQIIPASIGLIQGVSESHTCMNVTSVVYNSSIGMNITVEQLVPVFPPLQFSVKTFFFITTSILVSAGIAFTLLHFLPLSKRERLSYLQNNGSPNINPSDNDQNIDVKFAMVEDNRIEMEPEPRYMSNRELGFWLFLLFWSFAMMYGVDLPVLPYAGLPYGDRAYNLSVRLGLAMNPLVSFLALFVSTRSRIRITMIIIFGTLCVGYHLVLAKLSPYPPMKGEILGEVIMIATSAMVLGLFNFTRSCIVFILQDRGCPDALMYGAIAMNAGPLVGSIMILLILTFVQPFVSEPLCISTNL